jgi:hypothetical protein
MAYQKLQPTQAADVFLSDTINPIDPSRPENLEGTTIAPTETNKLTYLGIATELTTGTIDGGPTANLLIDSNATFTTAPAVEIGDTVVNTVDNTLAVVVRVDSATQLTLDVDIMDLAAEGYAIYSGQGFRDKVSIGDLVLNEVTNTLTAVTAITQTQLTFGSNVFPAAGVNFKAYGNAAQMNTDTEAFVVYVAADDASAETNLTIKVTTAAGNDISFNNYPLGTFLPVQCLRVWATGTDALATNVVALW